MDLSGHSLKDLLLTAIKGEMQSQEVYATLSRSVRKAFLKDRLVFLASEEQKHREFLEGLYRELFNEYSIKIPERSPVPLPEVRIESKYITPSEVMLKAMEAERAASEFYLGLSDLFSDENRRRTLQYLAHMEMGHYSLLEMEKAQLDEQENYEFEWEMMHVGP